jgi:hypothetical protein
MGARRIRLGDNAVSGEASSEVISLNQPPVVRAVMRIIEAEFNDYPENQDAAQWLVVDALAVTSRLDDGWTTQAAVVAGFNDSGRDCTDYDLGGLVARIDQALGRAS